MTKKHFKSLALAISLIRNMNDRKNTAFLIGSICKDLNSRFDWKIWNKACDAE